MGVRTGGAYLAHRLVDELVAAGEGKPVLGAIDITLYRDDVFHGLPKPEIGHDRAPRADSKDARVVLVDDVLFTGRTIRAAIDVLIDYGRPRAVELAVAGRSRPARAADPAGLSSAWRCRRRRANGPRHLPSAGSVASPTASCCEGGRT